MTPVLADEEVKVFLDCMNAVVAGK